MDGSDSATLTARHTKPRKHSYLIRREEKANLLRELEELQQILQELQQSEHQQSSGERQHAMEIAYSEQSLLDHELATSLLRDTVRIQQLSLVNVQSMVSRYLSVQDTVPHEMIISLGRNLNQRHQVLLGLKRRKIQAAVAYMSARTRFLDPFRPFSETSRFLLDNGDYCAHRMDRVPLNATLVTVRQLYDAVIANFASMEMRVTDVLGDITTRDETDYGVDGIQQSRYLSHLSCGVHLEMNSVTNWEYMECSDEHADGGPFAVMTADFVDKDELYPYSPHERVRQDMTAVITIRSHSRKRFDPQTNKVEGEAVVMMTRSCFVKLCRSPNELPPLIEHNLREQLGQWGDVMLNSVLEHVYARQHS